MDEARPLREVFDELATLPAGHALDPAALLREAGHGDLPAELLVPALSGYALSAPLPVAEAITELSGPGGPAGTEPVAVLDGLAGSAHDAGPAGLDGDPLAALDAPAVPDAPPVVRDVDVLGPGETAGAEPGVPADPDTAFGAGTDPEAESWSDEGDAGDPDHPATVPEPDPGPGWDAPGDPVAALDDLTGAVTGPWDDAVPGALTDVPPGTAGRGGDDGLDG